MKRSVAMMACVLSGAIAHRSASYSPVLAEGAKAVSAKSAEQETPEETKTDESSEGAKADDTAKGDVLEDGVYTAEFDTDSSMFHVNEANDGKGELTVKDGKMTTARKIWASKKDCKSLCGEFQKMRRKTAQNFLSQQQIQLPITVME